MKICLITGIFPPDIGGPATYVARLAESLHGQGHAVQVMTLGEDASAHAFPVRRISRRIGVPVRLLALFFMLLRHARYADIWYINGLELPAIAAGKLLRKRLIMKVVGDYAWERAMNRGMTDDSINNFQRAPQQWQINLHKTLRAWCARQTHVVITPSHYLKRLVSGWGVPEERIHVVYNAVENPPEILQATADVRRTLGFAHIDQVIITVGRLVRWKGIADLIRLMPQLKHDVKLLIVGDGPEKNMLTELSGVLRLGDRITFVGKASRNDTLAYLRAADLFVLNTAYEGFSHVLLEAMMMGVPIVTTSACGNPELVRHEQNGLLVSVGNPEELCRQIVRMLADDELRQHCVSGGLRSVEQFSWNRLLNETITLLADK